jgi:hypothetical protein
MENNEPSDRDKDLDSLIEVYRTAMQLGTWAKYALYFIGAVLAILVSIKKLRE